MKYKLSIALLLLAAMFASCNEESRMDEGAFEAMPTTLKVTANNGLQTRAAATGVDRFAIEVYTDAAYTTPATVFGSGEAATYKANNATGEFTMILDRTQAYYCLLWADKAGADVYNIDNLRDVTLTGKAAEAWHGTKEIAAGKQAVLTAMLDRAVSKISLMETNKLKAGGKLTLNLYQSTVFNVATTNAGILKARPEEIIDIAADVDGTTTPAKLNDTDIFVLAPVAIANLTDLTFKYNDEEAFTVSQAPLKANFNTNIKGHYTSKSIPTFTVACDDSWGAADNEETLTPPLIYSNDTEAVAPEGEGTEVAPYLLASAENIKWLQNLQTADSRDKHFKLMTDIEVTSDTWTSIGRDYDYAFRGCFDGNHHRFTGKLVAASNGYWPAYGIFGLVSSSTVIKNLINEAEVDALTNGNVWNVGGIVGKCEGIVINCKNKAKIVGRDHVGGIVGLEQYYDYQMISGSKSVISGCENSGEIIASGDNPYNPIAAAGGIAGSVNFCSSYDTANNSDVFCLLENCKNTGNVSGTLKDSKFVGGILGIAETIKGTCKVKGCSNTGTVKSGDVLATQDMGGDNKLGLLVGGQSSEDGYDGETVIEK